ncbi:MAG: type II toxin-antitoxin system RelE/ParE family toxin [Limisphaerales bacterium]
MRIRILDSALEDLDRGRLFYERQREGLGVYFMDSLFSEIDSLVLYAGLHRQVFGFHRALAKRFPYAVYYRVEADAVVLVWRVLDLRQAPERIRRALT